MLSACVVDTAAAALFFDPAGEKALCNSFHDYLSLWHVQACAGLNFCRFDLIMYFF